MYALNNYYDFKYIPTYAQVSRINYKCGKH